MLIKVQYAVSNLTKIHPVVAELITRVQAETRDDVNRRLDGSTRTRLRMSLDCFFIPCLVGKQRSCVLCAVRAEAF